MAGPLEGVRVADFSHWGVGPWCGMVLGALGATVVKVDAPEGDGISFLAGQIGGASNIYLNANLFKENIRLDLRREEGRERAYALVREADIFLQNYAPGVAERLGLDYETLSGLNRRLIYVANTPFGTRGPLARNAGIDPLLQAFSGFASITGSPGGRPELLRYLALIDLVSGTHMAMAALQGLVLREGDGRGRKVEVTMLGSALKLQSSRLAEFLATGEQPPLLGSAAATTAPHRAYRCREGEWLMVGVTSEAQWRRFCLAIGRPELADDPRFASNRERVAHREELDALLEPHFASRPYRWWEHRLSLYRVPHGRRLDFSLIRLHQEMGRYLAGVLHPRYGPFQVARFPLRYQRWALAEPWCHVDPLGESTTLEEALRVFRAAVGAREG